MPADPEKRGRNRGTIVAMGEPGRSLEMESWWAPTRLAAGAGLRWALGPLDLALLRSESEWHLAWGEREEASELEGSGWSVEAIDELPELRRTERYAAGEAADELRLRPRVADRSLVVRPRTPLYVLPGERAVVYVSSPLWIDVRVGNAERSLREVPITRLSDTWFGPSTREGEVAYALKTHARTRLDEMPMRPYRCITAVTCHNRGQDVMLVDRMSLPIPYLALYEAAGEQFWTQSVVLSRTADDQMAELEVRAGSPAEAPEARRVSEARRTASANLLVRAFSSLMRTFGEES
jgi:hypothetical protein